MRTLILFALGLAVVSAVPSSPQRIVGGSVTNIANYPYGAAMLFSRTGAGSFVQNCGGTILNNRSVLSAAHCFFRWSAGNWRIRVGSTNANSGGVVVTVNRILNHPNYNSNTEDADVSVLRINGAFSFNNNVRAGDIAGAAYNLGDNQAVWAIGWGRQWSGGPMSEQLRHVQVWTINQNTCRQRYAAVNRVITDNMLCSGVLDVGGRDQCQGDSGGPLIHGRVVVGVCSWGSGCAQARFPGVNARVSRFSTWIRNNA